MEGGRGGRAGTRRGQQALFPPSLTIQWRFATRGARSLIRVPGVAACWPAPARAYQCMLARSTRHEPRRLSLRSVRRAPSPRLEQTGRAAETARRDPSLHLITLLASHLGPRVLVCLDRGVAGPSSETGAAGRPALIARPLSPWLAPPPGRRTFGVRAGPRRMLPRSSRRATRSACECRTAGSAAASCFLGDRGPRTNRPSRAAPSPALVPHARTCLRRAQDLQERCAGVGGLQALQPHRVLHLRGEHARQEYLQGKPSTHLPSTRALLAPALSDA
jgi:hypothetical protein